MVGLVPVDTLLDVDEVTSDAEVKGAIAAFRADYKATASGFMRKYMFTDTTPKALVEDVVKDATSFPPRSAWPSSSGPGSTIRVRCWKEIHVPIVAVNADKFPTRLDHARQYAPQYDALIVKSMGHYLMREDPAAFNAQLARAVARVTGAAQPLAPR